jgi:hypothetical protein
MSRKSTKPLVDLDAGGTLQDVVAAAQGRALRIELESSMRYVDGELKMVCTARPMTYQPRRSGSATFVPLCMPIVGDTWSEVLAPLGDLLDQEQWTDVGVVP